VRKNFLALQDSDLRQDYERACMHDFTVTHKKLSWQTSQNILSQSIRNHIMVIEEAAHGIFMTQACHLDARPRFLLLICSECCRYCRWASCLLPYLPWCAALPCLGTMGSQSSPSSVLLTKTSTNSLPAFMTLTWQDLEDKIAHVGASK